MRRRCRRCGWPEGTRRRVAAARAARRPLAASSSGGAPQRRKLSGACEAACPLPCWEGGVTAQAGFSSLAGSVTTAAPVAAAAAQPAVRAAGGAAGPGGGGAGGGGRAGGGGGGAGEGRRRDPGAAAGAGLRRGEPRQALTAGAVPAPITRHVCRRPQGLSVAVVLCVPSRIGACNISDLLPTGGKRAGLPKLANYASEFTQ